jgi:dTDP-4-dehydrorhamnose reductase
MVIVLGATGYLGQAFTEELRRRRTRFVPLTRRAVDYTRFEVLFEYLRQMNPAFVINAAGFVGGTDGQDGGLNKAAVLRANTVFPQSLARACALTNTPFGHVSSAAMFSGAKIAGRMRFRVVRDLSRARVRWLLEQRPERLGGFTEFDEPNRTFHRPPCSFYAGTKALAEEFLGAGDQAYIWRPNVIFDGVAHPRNFLSAFHCFPAEGDSLTSFSHRGDFVRACLDLWEASAPFGIYNVVNPRPLTLCQVLETVRLLFKPDRHAGLLSGGNGGGCLDATTPRQAGCVLDVSKLLACGVRMRPAIEALEDSVKHWQPASDSLGHSPTACPETVSGGG